MLAGVARSEVVVVCKVMSGCAVTVKVGLLSEQNTLMLVRWKSVKQNSTVRLDVGLTDPGGGGQRDMLWML